jgi:hypothetical protein
LRLIIGVGIASVIGWFVTALGSLMNCYPQALIFFLSWNIIFNQPYILDFQILHWQCNLNAFRDAVQVISCVATSFLATTSP